ncbi:MAG TPA: ABC transporter substrate-binding protein [Methylomirabilota bacterium]|nr:ABC transporter substrate-binding protein [Methylomirabilota bacterium]
MRRDGARTERPETRLTRRQLLQLAAASSAIGVTLPLGAGRERAWAQAPRPGGTLKMAWASSPRTIDPALTIQGDEYMITQNVYDNLTRVDERLQVQPMLATKWSSDPQARIWTFTLRPGVKFHHGRELKASDVVFTFERILDPKTGSPGRTALGPIEKVEAVDDSTVRFRMSSPYADLPVNLGVTFGRILPADRADRIVSEPSGTGPFRLVEFKPGERTRMVRFPDYWDRPRPYLDELWQVNMPQHPTQVASLSGNDVQVMFEVPVAFIGALEKAPGVSVVSVKSTSFQPVVLATDHKPFDDNRVRLAMKLLVARDAVIKAVWQGRGTVGNDHPVPDINPFHAALPQRTQDVARARALLTEAGHPQGFSDEIWTSNERVGMQELAVVVQQMVAPAGIKLEVKTVPWSVFNSTVYKKKALYVNNWFGRATIDETVYPYFHTSGSWNEGKYSNPRLDRLLEEGRSSTDAGKRREAYAEVQRLISDEGHYIVSYFTQYVSAMRTAVKGYTLHPLRWCDFRNTYLEA